jgi:hypothetical protein
MPVTTDSASLWRATSTAPSSPTCASVHIFVCVCLSGSIRVFTCACMCVCSFVYVPVACQLHNPPCFLSLCVCVCMSEWLCAYECSRHTVRLALPQCHAPPPQPHSSLSCTFVCEPYVGQPPAMYSLIII